MSSPDQPTSPSAPPPGASRVTGARRPNYALHLGLLVATFFTTTWVGIRNAHPEVTWSDLDALAAVWQDGLSYSLSLLAILLTHEMGHFFAARRHGVRASLPYFLPIPLPLIGTMGAVIKMDDKITDRNALADIGAAGPLAGLMVAVPILAVGIHLSEIKPIGPGLLEGNSLLYLGLKLALKGAVLPGNGVDIVLHPVAWAGWVGLLVTMINLIPVGQLDGGHIAFAYFGDRYNRISGKIHKGLLLLALIAALHSINQLMDRAPLDIVLAFGVQAGFPWLVWALMLLVLRRLSGGVYHPPVGDRPLSAGRRRLCVLMFVLFVLILAPVPLRATL